MHCVTRLQGLTRLLWDQLTLNIYLKFKDYIRVRLLLV